MAESKEELKSLLMKVKEESKKAGLKLSIQKNKKIMASSSITSWQIDGETMETVTDFLSLGSKITADGDQRQMVQIYQIQTQNQANQNDLPKETQKKCPI